MTEYRLRDFIEEIDTVLWEKNTTLEKALDKHNEPIAGLTRLRIERLQGLGAYLRKIDDFQKGKETPETRAQPPEEEPDNDFD